MSILPEADQALAHAFFEANAQLEREILSKQGEWILNLFPANKYKVHNGCITEFTFNGPGVSRGQWKRIRRRLGQRHKSHLSSRYPTWQTCPHCCAYKNKILPD